MRPSFIAERHQAASRPSTAGVLLSELRRVFLCSLSILQFRIPSDLCKVSPPLTLVLLISHALGVLVIVRLARQPLWAAAFVVLLVVPAVLAACAPVGGIRRLLPATLAPLSIPYSIGVLRVVISLIVRRTDPQSEAVPEPWGTWLDMNIGMLLASGWVLLMQVATGAQSIGKPMPWRRLIGPLIFATTIGWASHAYIASRTHGVTASDPFAYLQMAVDLATHATPLHLVSLVPVAQSLDVSLWPLVPVGYSPPDPVTHLTTSAWPPGYSTLLALTYRLAGESGVYLATPLLGIAALIAMWWLGLEALHDDDVWRRRLSAGCAVLVLATSSEQIDRLVVPMADIPSQLFTVLTVTFGLRGARTGHTRDAVLSGLCLGVAFDSRYTQVLVAASLLLVWGLPSVRKANARGLVVSGIAALVAVLPLFLYHASTLGSPFSVESSEMQLFSLRNVPDTLVGVLGELLRTSEFLLVLPFGILGALYIYRTAPSVFAALAVWVFVLVAFHLPYAALRVRDVLSIYPVLALFVGLGISVAIDVRRDWLRRMVAVLIVAAVWLRSVPVLEATGYGVRYSGFGYLLPEQRAAFAALQQLTPDNAVVASTLNSGPVALYANRDAVRPAAWTHDEWLRFVSAMLEQGRGVFVLDDGEEMSAPRDALRAQYSLESRGELFVPYFSSDAGSINRVVTLYEIFRQRSTASPAAWA